MPCPENVLKHRMKKGETRNPNGRPKKFVSLLKEQGYSLSQVQDCIAVLISMTEGEIRTIYKDGFLNGKEATILEKTLASAILKDKQRGEIRSIEILLSRAFGTSTTKVDITSKDRQIFDWGAISTQELMARAKAIEAIKSNTETNEEIA